MRLEQFEYLIAVAELHSMQKASEIVHTTTQNISKSIKQLENELDTVLFVRNSYGVYLTKDGERLYEHAKAIVSHLNSIRNEYNLVSSLGKAMNNNITMNILCSQYMANVLSKVHVLMMQKYELTESDFFVKDAHNINRMLEADKEVVERFEVIATNVPTTDLSKYKDLTSNYICYFLQESKVGIRIAESHPLSREKSISIRKLDGLPLIQITPDIDETSYVHHMVESLGVNVQPKYKVNSVAQGREYISKKLGYTFTILASQEEEPVYHDWEGTVAIPLTEKLTATHILLIHNRFHKSSQAEELLHKVKKHYPKLHRI